MVKSILRSILYRLRGEYTTEKLVKMGMKVGKNFARLHGVILDPAHCWLIEIGDNVTMAPRVHVLTHDASTVHHFGYAKVGRVKIGNNVFIGAETVILPNVTHSLSKNSVYAGNPAKKISSMEDFLEKNRKLMEQCPCYGEEYTIRQNVDDKKKKQMNMELKNTVGFVK